MFLLPLSAVLLPLYHTSALLSIFGKGRRPWRGEKDLGGREPPLERRGLSPSKPPSLPENFPHVPAAYVAKICFAFGKRRGYGGSFCVWGGKNLLQSVAVALFLWVGGVRLCKHCVGGDLSPLISRLRDSFPPRGSLFARLPLHCITKQTDENMKYYLLHIYPLYIHCLRSYLLCMHGVKKASPWGEENCKQFVALATDEGG